MVFVGRYINGATRNFAVSLLMHAKFATDGVHVDR